jgi:hypothetical protein
MAVGHRPLARGGPCTKKTVIDKALHAHMAAIRESPQIHRTKVEEQKLQ